MHFKLISKFIAAYISLALISFVLMMAGVVWAGLRGWFRQRSEPHAPLCHLLAQPWGARATVPAGGTVETLPTEDPALGPRPCVTRPHRCGNRGSHVSRQAEPRATILIGWNADIAETGAVPCNSKGSFTSMRTISAEAGGC